MIEAYFTDFAVHIVPSTDKWGSATANTETRRRCRVEFGNRLVTDLNGRQVTSTARMILPHNTTVNFKHRFHYDGVTYAVLSKKIHKDWSGRFLEVFLA